MGLQGKKYFFRISKVSFNFSKNMGKSSRPGSTTHDGPTGIR